VLENRWILYFLMRVPQDKKLNRGAKGFSSPQV
jgi:hypothetical protein